MSQKEPRKRAKSSGGKAKPAKASPKPEQDVAADDPSLDDDDTDDVDTSTHDVDDSQTEEMLTPNAAEASTDPQSKLDELFDAVIAARIWAAPIVITVAVFCGYFLGVGTALLVLAGSVLLLVIGAFWASVQSLTGEQDLSVDEALSLAAPSAELEQKRAVLRALKDLEFEYRIGKVSQRDYDELSARYRAEAKRLLQALADVEAASRKDAEKMLRQRLRKLDPKLAELIGQLPVVQAAPTKGAAAEGEADLLGKAGSAGADDPLAAAADDEPVDDEPVDDELDGSPADDDEPDDDEGSDDDAAEESAAGEPAEAAGGEPEPVDDEVPKPPVVSGPSRRCPTCETRNPLDLDQCLECDAYLAKPNQTLCRSCPAKYPKAEGVCPVCGVPAAEGAK